MVRSILEDGLLIISQCKSITGDIWGAHFGAAAIAGYFFVKENSMPVDTVNRIKAQSEAMLDKHSYIGTAQPVVGMDSGDAEKMILESLELVIDELHWVGHNVIYAALSLLAIQELGGWGTKDEIQGISTLIRSFEKSIPGRSWLGYSISDVRKLEIDENDHFPAIVNAGQLSELILSELSSFRTIYRAEAHHDLIGHMLTFSHALNVLFDLGHVSYFKRGLLPLFKLVKVLRASHNLEPENPIKLSSPVDHQPLIRAKRSEWLPIEHVYWCMDYANHDWDFGHVFKFPFSFYNHLNRVPSRMTHATENFRYIVYNQSG
ncbi:hypothetical protein H1230_01735 [Paenibacillus sp. 19GGS1-52]|uniref:hypothetical protein n=1 Tax=Paenibacillus sp. 19GGS1-52 TaxID=2758563 RepID=UPI001EFC07B4|nr:hypothetical protein [Paenibacillus sp. 19GGS1-52]ULO07627.1 hypothetical protein H1230_01735 [Paenibacillus sp. 19GGS1-52]